MSFATPEQVPDRADARSAQERHLRSVGASDPGRASRDGERRTGSERRNGSRRAAEPAGLEAFAVDVERRGGVVIVRARGELDVATVETLRAPLDGIEDAVRLVLDLRGLSFIDSTGLHLVVALHERAQRDGFELALLAPAAPADRGIRICGLDKALPFVAAADANVGEPGQREPPEAEGAR